jgi:hypothetical protein
VDVRKLVALSLVLAACAGAAQAQVSRVFVSVTGNDANACSDIATPCRTFAGGIAQVDPQGEVIVIASGSYAGGTLTKSVKINVPAGIVAFSGLPITVDPGAGGTVVIRGLTLKAATPASGIGITHQSGTLFVENTVVDGWVDGLSAASTAEQLFVKGSVFRNQVSNGILSSAAVYAIDDAFFENNSTGVRLEAGTGRISNTVLAANSFGLWLVNSGTVSNLQRCEVSSNTTFGLFADALTTLRLSRSTIVRNDLGVANNGSAATVESFGNNVIRGNISVNTSGTITTVALQ